MQILVTCVIIIALITCISATINPSKNKKAKQKTSTEKVDLKIKKGAQDESVYERSLVDNEPLASDILIESNTYYKDTSLKNFNGTLLGYVTPVNFI